LTRFRAGPSFENGYRGLSGDGHQRAKGATARAIHLDRHPPLPPRIGFTITSDDGVLRSQAIRFAFLRGDSKSVPIDGVKVKEGLHG